MSNTLYWECYSGISGDMAVASLLDLGADEKVLREALQSLPVSGFQIRISRVKKAGLDACDFDVVLDREHENHDHDMEYLHGHRGEEQENEEHRHEENKHEEHKHEEHHHEGHKHGGHSHEHRGMIEIMDLIRVAEITDGARKIAVRIFEILAAAEAEAHQVPVEKVHFHEVGAVDSIVDILSVAVCLDNLGIDRVIVPVLYEGKGFVRCQHGLLPVPVPAVVNITAKHHLKLHMTDVEGELVTPTGAAIVAAVRTSSQLPKQYTIRKTGLGAGKRKYECPGFVRAMLIEEKMPEKEEEPKEPSQKEPGFVQKVLESVGLHFSLTQQIVHRFVGDESPEDGQYRSKVGNLASIVGIICNVVLFLGEIMVGLVFGSMAIVADAFHNLSDAGSSVIRLFGVWLRKKGTNEEHPDQNARYEYLFALAVCVVVLAIGLNFAVGGIAKVIHPTGIRFSWLTIFVLTASILVKLWLSYFNGHLADRIDSDTLRATSADERNDCLSTGAVLISSLLVSATHVTRIDGVMTVAVAAFILYSGYGMFRDALAPLPGERPDPEAMEKSEKRVMDCPQVLGEHDRMVHDWEERGMCMRVLCFGDSNTWGYIPGTGGRYESDVRWTGVLKQLTGFEVIEEGLNGRTTSFTDAVEPYRSGLDYIAPCVLSQLPLDVIVLMLGTNDTKRRYHVSANEIRRSMQEVIWRIRDMLGRKGSNAEILLIAPPLLKAQADFEDFDQQSEQKISRLEKEYEELASEMGCMFLKAGEFVTQMGVDGLHFTPEGHRALAEAIAEKLNNMHRK